MQFFTALAVIAAAVSVEAAAAPERSSGFFPFFNLSCRGCLPGGNLLPVCSKVNVATGGNIYCPKLPNGRPMKKVGLDTCVTVLGSQVVGPVRSAVTVTGTVAGSQITCSADSPIDSACIQVTDASFPADFVLPSSVTVAGSQVTGEIAADQITGVLGAGASIAGSQITGSVSSSTTAGTLVCPVNATANSIPLPSCYSITTAQVQGPINATQLTGTLGSNVTLSGAQVTSGEIPAAVKFNGTLDSNACNSVLSGCFAGVLALSTNMSALTTCVDGVTVILQLQWQCPPDMKVITTGSQTAYCPAPTWFTCAVGTPSANFIPGQECMYNCGGGNPITTCGTAPTTTLQPFLCA